MGPGRSGGAGEYKKLFLQRTCISPVHPGYFNQPGFIKFLIMDRKEQFSLLAEIIVGIFAFGLLVNLGSNLIEPGLKEFLAAAFPRIPYYVFVGLAAVLLTALFILVKSRITRQQRIRDFSLPKEQATDARLKLVEMIKKPGFDGHTIKGIIDSQSAADLIPMAELLRLKLRRKNIKALAEYYFKKGKLLLDKKLDIPGAADCFDLAGKLVPHYPLYPNEAGVMLMNNGETELAKVFFQDALKNFVADGDGAGLALAKNNLGNVFLRGGEFTKAATYFGEAKQGYLRYKSQYTGEIFACDFNLAAIENSKGNQAAALQLMKELKSRVNDFMYSSAHTVSSWQRGKMRLLQSQILHHIAGISLRLYEQHANPEYLEAAKDAAERAVRLDEADYPQFEELLALSYYTRGKVFDAAKDYTAALANLKKAYAYFQQISIARHEPREYCEKRIPELEKLVEENGE